MYKNRPAIILTTVAVTQFMVALDMAVTNVALPAIRDALGFGAADLAWVVQAYALATTPRGAPSTLGTLSAAVLLLATFVLVESHVADPLLRLGLLRSRWVAGANVFVFLAAAGQFAAFYVVSLYMQQVLRMDAAATGAAFLPFSACAVVGTVVATRITGRAGPRAALVPGGLLAAAGLAWFATLSPTGGFLADVLGPSLVTGVGLGLCLGPVAVAATTDVAPHEAGTASGLLNSARQLGGCVGLAVLATVAAARTGTATSPAAVTDGYALGLGIAAALFVLGAAIALVVLPGRRRDPRTSEIVHNATLEGTAR